MYNRYIPQSDGSYRRSRVPDRVPESPKPPIHPHSPPGIPSVCQEPVPCPPPPKKKPGRPVPEKKPSCQNPDSLTGFFRNLLPKDLDTGDLLIILLLLLMCGDREEDKSNALLTLALYFFM